MTRVRFHLDEQVNPAIITALRRYSINVTTTIEAGLRTSSDAGIVYSKKDTRSIGQIVDGLILIYEVLSDEEMRDRIEFL